MTVPNDGYYSAISKILCIFSENIVHCWLYDMSVLHLFNELFCNYNWHAEHGSKICYCKSILCKASAILCRSVCLKNSE